MAILLAGGCAGLFPQPDPATPGDADTPAQAQPSAGPDEDSFTFQSFSRHIEPPPDEAVAAGRPAPSDDKRPVAASPDGETVERIVEQAPAELFPQTSPEAVVRHKDVIEFCNRISQKLHSITFAGCLLEELHHSQYHSTLGTPLYYAEFGYGVDNPGLGRVLVLGGVHGDELTSVTSTFQLIDDLSRAHSGLFHWRIAPLVNPDGFFRKRSSRTNANGVDLNRNLPTSKWDEQADYFWKSRSGSAEGRYPGPYAASEIETRWLIEEIDSFKPDVIVSVHAPYNLVDFDAQSRDDAPGNLGILPGRLLGTFPGSLGRYAGEQKNIPVITIELPNATRMLEQRVMDGIWTDLFDWLQEHIDDRQPGSVIMTSGS